MKISIITVSHNSEKYIEECIKSVLEQSYKNIEYIVIDGKSSDKTEKILNKYKKYISTILIEADKGVYHAMNKGISKSSGDIIGFLNSDDFYANSEVISKVASTFEKNKLLEACYGNLFYVDQLDTSKVIRYWKSSKFKSGYFSRGWCPPHPTFFVKSSVYKRLGNFNLKYTIASDVELMMRFLEVSEINACYVSDLWIKMRKGGISNKNLKNIIKLNREIFQVFRSHKLHYNIFIFVFCKIIMRIKQFILARFV